MKVQLLPSSIEYDGSISLRQHLTCVVIDDRVAFDAGSLAFACTEIQRQQVRDIVLSHAHLDHIAGLPMFLDDLFASLTEPVRVHASRDIIDVLERDIFNWSVYPRFSELENEHGAVMTYRPIESGVTNTIGHLSVTTVEVNHNVPSSGFLVSDAGSSVGLTGDTAATDAVWKLFSETQDLTAVLVESAFPDEMVELANISHHLTPAGLALELTKFDRKDVDVFVVNIKPMYRERVVREIRDLAIERVRIMEPGRIYDL